MTCYVRGHAKSTYAFKGGEGVLNEAYGNVQGGLFKELTYAHVLFKRLLLANNTM